LLKSAGKTRSCELEEPEAKTREPLCRVKKRKTWTEEMAEKGAELQNYNNELVKCEAKQHTHKKMRLTFSFNCFFFFHSFSRH
jgi:hypothetical protein